MDDERIVEIFKRELSNIRFYLTYTDLESGDQALRSMDSFIEFFGVVLEEQYKVNIKLQNRIEELEKRLGE